MIIRYQEPENPHLLKTNIIRDTPNQLYLSYLQNNQYQNSTLNTSTINTNQPYSNHYKNTINNEDNNESTPASIKVSSFNHDHGELNITQNNKTPFNAKSNLSSIVNSLNSNHIGNKNVHNLNGNGITAPSRHNNSDINLSPRRNNDSKLSKTPIESRNINDNSNFNIKLPQITPQQEKRSVVDPRIYQIQANKINLNSNERSFSTPPGPSISQYFDNLSNGSGNSGVLNKYNHVKNKTINSLKDTIIKETIYTNSRNPYAINSNNYNNTIESVNEKIKLKPKTNDSSFDKNFSVLDDSITQDNSYYATRNPQNRASTLDSYNPVLTRSTNNSQPGQNYQNTIGPKPNEKLIKPSIPDVKTIKNETQETNRQTLINSMLPFKKNIGPTIIGEPRSQSSKLKHLKDIGPIIAPINFKGIADHTNATNLLNINLTKKIANNLAKDSVIAPAHFIDNQPKAKINNRNLNMIEEKYIKQGLKYDISSPRTTNDTSRADSVTFAYAGSKQSTIDKTRVNQNMGNKNYGYEPAYQEESYVSDNKYKFKDETSDAYLNSIMSEHEDKNGQNNENNMNFAKNPLKNRNYEENHKYRNEKFYNNEEDQQNFNVKMEKNQKSKSPISKLIDQIPPNQVIKGYSNNMGLYNRDTGYAEENENESVTNPDIYKHKQTGQYLINLKTMNFLLSSTKCNSYI